MILIDTDRPNGRGLKGNTVGCPLPCPRLNKIAEIEDSRRSMPKLIMRIWKKKTGQSTRDKGRHAEDVAADHLKKQGYRIVARNFTCKLGEVDIIARHDGVLVFVEVRSRNSPASPDPAYSITQRKQHMIHRVARVYLSRHFRTEPESRFDVVLVTMSDPPDVRVIQDAFWAP